MRNIEISSPTLGTWSLVLDEGEFVIGRSAEADIRIDSPEVSGFHAKLTLSGDRATIEDLGSINGVEAEGRLVQGSAEVSLGQSFRVGGVELRLGEGEVFGSEARYEKRSLIAEGGMGEVYGAWQDGMDREVAMKLIRGDADDESVRRFFAEARVTGRLEHPNIVPVHEIGWNPDGKPFYTMKYVRGGTLADIIKSLRAGHDEAAAERPLSSLLTIFQKVCDAISFAHSRGVIHRDLKPDNIMVGDHGEVLVMDWGVAKILGDREGGAPGGGDDGGGSTMSGSLIGTPSYMAPEQARGEVDWLDVRADVFALGRILFELLHLQLPVRGGSAFEILEKVRSGERDPVVATSSAHLPGRRPPEALVAVCRKAMEHDREDRYASVQELQREISAYQGGFATSAQNADLVTQVGLFAKRHKAVVGSVAASLALLLVMGVVFVVRVVEERDRAVAAEAQERSGRIEIERLWAEVSDGERAMARKNVELDQKNSDLLREFGEKAAALAVAEDRLARLQAAGDRAREVGEAIPELQGGYAKLEIELAEAWAELSKAYAREGQLIESLESARRAAEAAPSRPTRMNYGTRLLLAGNYAQAATQYRAALDSGQTEDPDAKAMLALAEKSQAEVDELGKIREQTLAEIRAAMERLGQVKESAVAIGKLALEGVEHSDPEAARAKEELEKMKREIHGEALDRLASLRGIDGWRDDRIVVNDDSSVRLNLDHMPVRSLPDLGTLKVRELNLHRTGIRDLDLIKGLDLKWLDIGANFELKDLSALRGMPLEHLSLWDNRQIDDYSAVEGLRDLRYVALPPNCSGFDCSQLGKLEIVQHYRFFPGFWTSGRADEFIRLSMLSDIAWEKWSAHLERMKVKDMRRDRLTVVVDQSEQLEKGFELDLRGTGIVDLSPLAVMPIERLLIDTDAGRTLDPAPLRDIGTLKSLYLMGADIETLKPAFPLKGLEILVPSRKLRDLNLMSAHPTLQWVGYAHNWDLRRPELTKEAFFRGRNAEPGFDRTGLVYEENFDDLVAGAGSWRCVDDRGETLNPVWASDTEFTPYRGGGYLSFHELGSDGKGSDFAADEEFVAALKRAAGGLLEFELRQLHSGDFDQQLKLELKGRRGRLVRTEPVIPELCWTRFAVPLSEEGKWERTGARQGLATNQEIAEVIRSLEEVLVTSEFSTRGYELSGLDGIRIWNREGGVRRLAELEAEREKRAGERAWAADARIVSDLNYPRTTAFHQLRQPYEIWREGLFISDFEKRRQVLLVHPLTQDDGPAVITVPIPPGGAKRFELESRSWTNVGDGVLVKARIGGRQIFEEQVDGEWKRLAIALPDGEREEEVLTLEIWPLLWNSEYCFLAVEGFK